MSMLSDIDWLKKDEICISNAEKVKNYANKFLPGHCTFPGPGSEENGTAIPRNRSSIS